MSELTRKIISIRADVPFSLWDLELLLVYSQNYRSTSFIVDIYRRWPVSLVVLAVEMFIIANELAFATQFMSHVSMTDLTTEGVNGQFIYSINYIRVHESCRNKPKTCCSSCFEVLQTLNFNAIKLICHLVWFFECAKAKYRNL